LVGKSGLREGAGGGDRDYRTSEKYEDLSPWQPMLGLFALGIRKFRLLSAISSGRVNNVLHRIPLKGNIKRDPKSGTAVVPNAEQKEGKLVARGGSAAATIRSLPSLGWGASREVEEKFDLWEMGTCDVRGDTRVQHTIWIPHKEWLSLRRKKNTEG